MTARGPGCPVVVPVCRCGAGREVVRDLVDDGRTVETYPMTCADCEACAREDRWDAARYP